MSEPPLLQLERAQSFLDLGEPGLLALRIQYLHTSLHIARELLNLGPDLFKALSSSFWEFCRASFHLKDFQPFEPHLEN